MRATSVAAPARQRRRRIAVMFALGACALTLACAPPQVAGGDAFDATFIGQDEIDASQAQNALEIVTKLRPLFLASRGQLTVGSNAGNELPNVYVDDQYYGDATILRTIAAVTVESIRYYSASEAQFKFGRGNAAGVIDIATKH